MEDKENMGATGQPDLYVTTFDGKHTDHPVYQGGCLGKWLKQQRAHKEGLELSGYIPPGWNIEEDDGLGFISDALSDMSIAQEPSPVQQMFVFVKNLRTIANQLEVAKEWLRCHQLLKMPKRSQGVLLQERRVEVADILEGGADALDNFILDVCRMSRESGIANEFEQKELALTGRIEWTKVIAEHDPPYVPLNYREYY